MGATTAQPWYGSSPRARGKRGGFSLGFQRLGLIPACAGKTRQAQPPPRPPTAHPRVCGENSAGPVEEGEDLGSSPRVRGKQLDRLARRGLTRLIPACAGKTAPRFAGRRDEWAHPRVCGENYNPDLHICVQPGSSPRVRGKRNSENARDLSRGLIPACAGKTQPPGLIQCRDAAHPRVCGENMSLRVMRARLLGSSPRVRGKHTNQPFHNLFSWLIPACAGKTKCGPR